MLSIIFHLSNSVTKVFLVFIEKKKYNVGSINISFMHAQFEVQIYIQIFYYDQVLFSEWRHTLAGLLKKKNNSTEHLNFYHTRHSN